jgi:hypothetical protein
MQNHEKLLNKKPQRDTTKKKPARGQLFFLPKLYAMPRAVP